MPANTVSLTQDLVNASTLCSAGYGEVPGLTKDLDSKLRVDLPPQVPDLGSYTSGSLPRLYKTGRETSLYVA